GTCNRIDACSCRQRQNHVERTWPHRGHAEGSALMSEAQFGLTGATGTEAPVVTATGEIDLANVNEFQDALTKAANGAPALAVALSRVSYCDSSAVRALFSVAGTTKLSLV